VENLDRFYQREGKAFEESFAPVARAMSQYNNSYYAITHELSGQDALWYNVRMLKEANIDPKDALSSWEKFVDASKKLTKDGKYAIAIRGKDVTNSVSVLWSYIAQKTGPLVTEADIKNNLCTSGPQEVFRSYVELYTVHGVTPNPVDVDFTVQKQMFAQEKTAFLDQGSWMGPITDAENPAMQGNHLPLPKPLFSGGKATMQTVALSMMIGKGSKNADEAWNFIKFVTSPERQVENLEKTNFMPSKVELIQSAKIQQDPVFGMFSSEMAKYGYPRPSTPKLNEMWTVMHREFQNALLKSKDADQAFRDACNTINSEILK
jgi:ABC-type glycerol-3-phosphate transport system substrate-binding protein